MSDTSIVGRIISSDNNLPINNAKLVIAENGAEFFTDTLGKFSIESFVTGLYTVTITADDYNSRTMSILSGGGLINLREISLVPAIVNITSSTLLGRVTDNTFLQNPLTGASVTLPALGLSTITDENGEYLLTDIPDVTYQAQFVTPGYESLFFEISSTEHTTSELNVQLKEIGSSPLRINEFIPEQFEYQGVDEVEIDIELQNTGSQTINTRLYLRILNQQGTVESHFPVKEIPYNGTELDASEVLNPYEMISTRAMFGTRFMQPGDYQLVLLAFDEFSVELLKQASTTISILPVKNISGSVTFDPDITNFDINQLINIHASLIDTGTTAVENVDVTANVYLVDKENNSNQLLATVINEYSDILLNSPTLMHKDTNNELLIYAAATGNIIRFDNNDNFEVEYNVGTIRDFSLSSTNLVHTIDNQCNLKIYDSTGIVISDFTLGITGCKDIEVLNDNDNVNIISTDGIFNLEIGTGLLTQIAGEYLKDPQGMIKHTDGRLLIADGDANVILSYENAELSTWVTGLSNPHGICEDIDGTVLVANYNNNEIIRVAIDGTTSVFSSGIPAPYDIQLNPAGGYYVSSETENKLYQVNSDGSFVVIYDSYINIPRLVVSGNNSDVYIYNSTDQTLLRRLSDGTVIELGTSTYVVTRMIVDQLDNLILVMGGRFYRQEADLTFTQLSSTGVTVAAIVDGDIPNEYRFFNSFLNKFGYLDATGNITHDDIKKPFGRILATKTDSNGLIYILAAEGKIFTVDEDLNYSELISGLSSVFDMYISPTDEIYVSKYSKEIIKIDSALNITTIATVDNSPRHIVINNAGEVIYSDQTSAIYKNNGTTEVVYALLNANVSGDLAIDSLDRLWVTHRTSSNNITFVNNDLSINEIVIDSGTAGIIWPQSIAIDFANNSAWIAARDNVFFMDSNGNIGTINQSSDYPSSAHLTLSNNNFYLSRTYFMDHFDSAFNYQKTYSTYSQLHDMIKTDNGNLIMAVKSPHSGIIQYTDPNKLPEYIINGNYPYLDRSDQSNHVLGFSLNAIKDIDLINKSTTDKVTDIGSIADFTQVNGTEIHLVDHSKNQYSIYNFSNELQFNLFGLNNLQGLAVDDNNNLYLTDTENTYKFLQNNEIELFDNFNPGGYMQHNNGTIFKVTEFPDSLYAKNIITGENNTYKINETSRISTVYYEADNNIKIVSTRGLLQFNLTGDNTVLLSSVDNTQDILQTNDGNIYLGTGNNSDVGGILQLTNGIFSNYRSNTELSNVIPDTLVGDNNTIYAFSNSGVSNNVIQLGNVNRRILNPFAFLYNDRLRSLVVIGNNMYGINGSSTLFKVQLSDPQEQTPLIGDLVHSSTLNVQLNSLASEHDFTPFNVPIAGEYSVVLEFSDEEIISDISDALHIGNLATGQIQLSTNNPTPGNSILATSAYIEGLDISAFVDLIAEQAQEIYRYDGTIFPTTGFIVKDDVIIYQRGNGDLIYKYDRLNDTTTLIYTSPNLIRRIIKGNNQETILLGTPTRWLDDNGNVYKEKDYAALFGINILNGNVDTSNNLIVHANSNVYKIDVENDSIETIRSNVIPESNLWVTQNNNIYLMGTQIIEISQTNNTMKVLKDDIQIEQGEGTSNAVAVCVNTPLYTDTPFGEEESIYAGAIRRDLIYDYTDLEFLPERDSPWNADFESLIYDIQTNKLIISEHISNGGRFFTVPVNCGKMYVELHLTDQADTSLSGFDILPDQTIEVAENTHKYVWIIDELDEVQKIFNFQTHVDDLLPNESRSILSSAYLKFKNGLDTRQDLIVNLDIPNILGVIDRSLIVNLDNSEYEGNTDIQISSTVDNTALIAFDGILLQHIEDSTGNFVVSLGQQNIVNLAPQSQLELPFIWNTLNYYAGEYNLISQLFDAADHIQDEKTTPFAIKASEINAANINLHILTDKAQYPSIDAVEISLSVTNLADNNIIQNHQAQLLVSNPSGTVILQQTTAVTNLTPLAIQSWQQILNLNQATIGSYIVTLNLLDDQSIIVANQTSTFNVVLDEQLSLLGTVLVANEQIQPPMNNSCDYELTNTSTQTTTDIRVHQTVVNLSNQLTLQDDVLTIDLLANTTWTNNQNVSTNQMSSGDHACVLRTVINSAETTQASDIFFVTGANQISGIIWDDSNGDGIYDNDETGIELAEIKLLDTNQQVLQTKLTNNTGNYQFDPVNNGQYTLQVTETGVLLNHVNTFGGNPVTIDLQNNHQILDFGYLLDTTDLSISTSNCVRGLQENQNITYQVEVNNLGGTDIIQAQVSDSIPIGLSDINWICQATGGASCTASGTDAISDTIDMPRGSRIIYYIDATVNAQLGAQITHQTSVIMPAGIIDDFPANNTALDSDTVRDIIFANGFDCAAPTPMAADIFDLAISTSNCTQGLQVNQSISYMIQVNNLGNTNIQQAQVNSPIPAGLADISWVCAATGAATCGASSGNTHIDDNIDMPAGSSIQYTLNGTVSAQLLEIISSNASITMPAGITDDFPINNTAQDSDMVLDILFINGFECSAPTSLDTSQSQQQKILWSILQKDQKSKTKSKLMSYISTVPYWGIKAGEQR
ncbi:hypothetical protein MNBD_GAMMA01-977 [hydrothermal vent metagenome]|uniref:Uncharacterized protein n=1 Tax=hydrothermal vent metagenome TaxID=652676 RepID=A0A3B0VA17_9ZZZZ